MHKLLRTIGLLMGGLGLCLGLFSLSAARVLATNYGQGNYEDCNYNGPSTSCSISIGNNGFTLFLPVNPTIAGSCTTQSDQVSVTTHDPNGYTLTLANQSTNTGLLNGASSVPAASGTPTSPIALTNTWGYRVDGWSGFGAGPTSPVTNASPSGITFAGTQPSNVSPDTIAQTSTENDNPISTMIWYGICVNTNLNVPAGSYASSVLYTATAN